MWQRKRPPPQHTLKTCRPRSASGGHAARSPPQARSPYQGLCCVWPRSLPTSTPPNERAYCHFPLLSSKSIALAHHKQRACAVSRNESTWLGFRRNRFIANYRTRHGARIPDIRNVALRDDVTICRQKTNSYAVIYRNPHSAVLLDDQDASTVRQLHVDVNSRPKIGHIPNYGRESIDVVTAVVIARTVLVNPYSLRPDTHLLRGNGRRCSAYPQI